MGVLLEPFFYIIALVVDIYFKVVVVEVVLHWLIHFKILEANNKYAQKTMEILEKATDYLKNFTDEETLIFLIWLNIYC